MGLLLETETLEIWNWYRIYFNAIPLLNKAPWNDMKSQYYGGFTLVKPHFFK